MRNRLSKWFKSQSETAFILAAIAMLMSTIILIAANVRFMSVFILLQIAAITIFLAVHLISKQLRYPITHLVDLKKAHVQAVTGFVDMTSSSAISNVIGIAEDWELKQKFFATAAIRAEEFEMTVLNHTGDGFLFIANLNSTTDWQYKTIAFFEALTADYELMQTQNSCRHSVETGLRFGLALGPAMVGLISSSPSFYTAVGADVNLAARLTAVAKNHQLVITSRIWYALKPLLDGWDTSMETHQFKGFLDPIPCVRVRRRLKSDSTNYCYSCGSKHKVVQTGNGMISIGCECL